MKELNIRTGREAQVKGPSLDPATFENLRRRITASSGIYVLDDENSRFILERRLSPRLGVRGVTSFSDYERGLDPAEIETMLDAVAVHETYFFREKRQLKTFADSILPELSLSKGRIRIWSAGCSTGEEAYTIAMLLAEAGLLDSDRAEVVASDLSRRVIASAIKGEYGASSFRTTEPDYKERYFSEVAEGRWRANDSLRSSVHFEQYNLINLNGANQQRLPAGRGRFDVIFCRNVLMYFDDAAVKSTLDSMHALLGAGGYLLLGHAESLLPSGRGFETIQLNRELVHRKQSCDE